MPLAAKHTSTPSEEFLKNAGTEEAFDDVFIENNVNGSKSDAGSDDKHLKIGNEESRRVVFLRVVVLLVLTAVSVAISTLVYLLYRNSQHDAFESHFHSSATKLTDEFLDGAKQRVAALEGFALQLVSEATTSSNISWPFVVLSDFERKAANAILLSDVVNVLFFPLVTKENRAAYEEFTVENQDWLIEGLEVQGIPQEDWDFATIAALESVFGPSSDDLQINEEIFRLGPMPETGDGPYLPLWQFAPAVPISSIVNFNALSHPGRAAELSALLELDHSIMTTAWDYADLDDPQTLGKRASIQLFLQHGGRAQSYEWGPASDLYIPIFGDFDDNATVAGYLNAFVYWQVYFENILSKDDDGVIVVLENSCNQSFSYLIEGATAQYIGPGDLHESQFDGLTESTEFGSFLNNTDLSNVPAAQCLYRIRVYPTTEMEDDFLTNEPRRFTMILAFTMLFSCAVFVLYDILVERRQEVVMTSAQQSGAVVNALFPEEVRDRLYKEHGKADEERNARPTFLNDSSSRLLMDSSHRSHRDRGQVEGLEDQRMAIADLYPNCTVCFMDLVGFTKWSSEREPWKVFKLLESLYKKFDTAAERLGVFKVETIGDCYVAVTGLPRAQPNHAIIMARFVATCLVSAGPVVQSLIGQLGEETSNLTLRCGMHSGPVTAGVLRGAKARFQLFGDTVNMAARMESTGAPRKIQVSDSTAKLLMAGNHKEWVSAREDEVNVKGKGMLRTYWLKLEAMSSADRGALLTDGSGHSSSRVVGKGASLVGSS